MIDTASLWASVESAVRSQNYESAKSHLLQLVQVVDRIDFEYEEWVRALAETYRAMGEFPQLATCLAYLGATEVPSSTALPDLAKQARNGNTASLLDIRLRGIYLSRAGLHEASAQWFQSCSFVVQQAIELERCGQTELALAIWRELIDGDELSEAVYELALAQINIGLCAFRINRDESRSEILSATTALEQVADHFERQGLRERSFDCYQLLARIGSETGTFENVAEGYLNSIRILKNDGLRLDALRLYEALVAFAKQAREYHACATILGEAAEYCWKTGLPYGDDLCWRSADAWVVAAEFADRSAYPPQIIENAYNSAATAYASVRAFAQTAKVYRTLVNYEEQGWNVEKYVRLTKRLGNTAADAPRPIPVPDFLKQVPQYEEVWYVDIAEWELAGEPTLTAAGIMADRRFPDFVRRHALLLILEIQGDPNTPLDSIVERLRSIRAYPVIAALEQIYQRGDTKVRSKVARALGSLRFKRSFTLINQAIRSSEARIQQAAMQSIRSLFFPHAFDPLKKIFYSRDFQNEPAIRKAALDAIGRMNSIDSVEFLCDRLREDESEYAPLAASAIAQLTNVELVPFLRQQLEIVPPKYRSALEDCAQSLLQAGASLH